MKQFILFTFTFIVVGVSAQTLHVEAHENNLSSSDLWSEMVTEIKVENISQSNTVEVKVSKEILVAPANTTNYFCWVNCFLPQTIVSQQITFAPGDVDEINFSVHFNARIEQPQWYCAFDADNVADSACTIVHYNTVSTDIIQEDKILTFSDFHPNPSSLISEMNYNLLPGQQAEVLILDMLGNIVKKHQLSAENGRLSFKLTDLKMGLYFANIIVDGQLHEVKRLIISD